MDRTTVQQIFETYKEVINGKSIEYFAARNWTKLPQSWRNHLENCTIEEVVELVNDSSSSLLPLSLLSLKVIIRQQCYDRKPVESPEELWKIWSSSAFSVPFENTFKVISSEGVIRKKIKIKKQHEIDRIVELVRQIQVFYQQKECEIDSLVDIGAGVGHLSRVIALHNKLAVMAVEGNDQFTIAANSLDEKLITTTGQSLQTPTRFTTFVTEDLADKIDNFAENAAILVGLHTCGDFATTILKVFEKSSKAKALILLGCCYHKEYQCFHFYQRENSSNEALPSAVFPLSQKWKNYELSYVFREMACHNNENLMENARKQNIARYARAHLERWIWEISEKSEDRNIGMSPVKCEEGKTTFEEYIRRAMAKRGANLVEDVIKKIAEKDPQLLSTPVSSLPRKNFDKTDTVRMIFAPIIESTIIDDRLEYLREKGIDAKAVPIFEPTISPRNIAIVANKLL